MNDNTINNNTQTDQQPQDVQSLPQQPALNGQQVRLVPEAAQGQVPAMQSQPGQNPLITPQVTNSGVTPDINSMGQMSVPATPPQADPLKNPVTDKDGKLITDKQDPAKSDKEKKDGEKPDELNPDGTKKDPQDPDKQKAQTDEQSSMAVTKRDVENVVSSWTGIPISKLTEDESAKLLELEKRIHERLIDQEEAVVKVAEAVRRGRIGLASGQRPIASFIFLGPSGTGKTELAKTLAEILFGRDDMMVRLDMSEYMEKHEVAKLIGAPPGYVGYEEGGQLTEAVRAKPYSIVLLDEVEKAHPDVFNILLQLLEDGRLTDNKGNTISFKNTIIICTSNIGSALITDKLSQQDIKVNKTPEQYTKQFAELSAVVNNELKKFFRPELLNRYDDIVIFKPLRREDMVGIAKLGVEKTAKLLKEQGYKVQITERALNKLAREGYDPMYGARPLRRLIQNSLENPIALEIIGRKYVAGDTILIDFKGETNAFSFTKPAQQLQGSINDKPDGSRSGNKELTEEEKAKQEKQTKDGQKPRDGDGKEQPGDSGVKDKPVQPGQPEQSTQATQSQQESKQQMFYGEQISENTGQVNQPGVPVVPPVSDFDPLSVLGEEAAGQQTEQSTLQDSGNQPAVPSNISVQQPGTVIPAGDQPAYPLQPPSTGAYISGGTGDTMVNTGRFQQGAANEMQEQPVLNGSQLTGSGLEVLNEEL